MGEIALGGVEDVINGLLYFPVVALNSLNLTLPLPLSGS